MSQPGDLLPPLGAPVLLSVVAGTGGWEQGFRIIDDNPSRLVLEPMDGGGHGPLPDDAEVCLAWPVPAGECLLPVGVHGAASDARVVAVPAGPPRVAQRRRYVRVREDLGVRVRLPTGSVLARGADLSEAGLRCRLPASVPCSPGTPV